MERCPFEGSGGPVTAVCWTRPEENESGGAGFGLKISTAPDDYKAYVRRLVASTGAAEPGGAP